MKNITVKINDNNTTVETVKLITQDSQVTRIKAQEGVIYEFVHEEIARAPNHIVAKRQGNDLHLSFEESGLDNDLIIEDYYDFPESYLTGQAENGLYYYYVPDTGEIYDFVNNILAGEIEGHALGGESFIVPWWVGSLGQAASLPWLPVAAAIAPVIGAAALLADDNDDNTAPSAVADSQTSPEDTAVTGSKAR